MASPDSHRTIAALAVLAASWLLASGGGNTLLTAGVARAATDAGTPRFVGQSHPNARDAPANGSESNPWRTVEGDAIRGVVRPQFGFTAGVIELNQASSNVPGKASR